MYKYIYYISLFTSILAIFLNEFYSAHYKGVNPSLVNKFLSPPLNSILLTIFTLPCITAKYNGVKPSVS